MENDIIDPNLNVNQNLNDNMNIEDDVIDNNEPTTTLLKKNIIDLYADRMNRLNWYYETARDYYDIAENYDKLFSMSLIEFCQLFYSTNKSKIRINDEKSIIVFIPEFYSTVESPNYPSYCYYNLMKFKCWHDYPESVYDGNINSFEIDILLDDTKSLIIDHWNDFCQNLNEHEIPDTIQQQIDRLRNREEGIEWTQLDDGLIDMDIDDQNNNNDYLMLSRQALIGDLFNDPNVIEWNHNHDWTSHFQTYNGVQNDYIHHDHIKQRYEAIINQQLVVPNYVTVPPDIILNYQQQFSYDVIIETVESIDYTNKKIIMIGVAGTGKTLVINKVVEKYNGTHRQMYCTQPLNLSSNPAVLCAPTGKAASSIDGKTIHSLLSIFIRQEFKLLDGDCLRKLQEIFINTILIIIDEYTMMDGKLLHQIQLRCQQAKNCFDKPFGGMTILIVGDPAQLPPVASQPLWYIYNKQRLTNREMMHNAGNTIYNSFKKVVKLSESKRLREDQFKPILERILTNMRNGICTHEDFTLLNHHSSQQYHQINRLNINGLPLNQIEFDEIFQGNDSTWYYNTNKEIIEHNLKMLRKLNKPIIRVDSKNTGSQRNATDDNTRKLLPTSYYAIDSKVMVTWNLNVKYGLVNGSTGTIKDILYHSRNPLNIYTLNDQPYAIIVKINGYNGPQFFPEDPQKLNWLPLFPQTASWSYSDQQCTRTAYPISLAWAWTPWKAQGTTNDGICVLNPGLTEKSEGLLYVLMSRPTSLTNIYIPGTYHLIDNFIICDLM